MDEELKAKWVKALRSGEYKQGQWKLRTADGAHCCLGVLACVSGIGISDDGSTVPKGRGVGYGPIVDLIGGDATRAKLTGMNDHGESFAKIADYIEQNL